jgi:hypothetical protein
MERLKRSLSSITSQPTGSIDSFAHQRFSGRWVKLSLWGSRANTQVILIVAGAAISAELFVVVHRVELDLGFVRLLGDLMIAAAIPATTNVSKSISSFGNCGPSGLLCARDSSSDFRLAIGSSPREAAFTHSDIMRPAIFLPST